MALNKHQLFLPSFASNIPLFSPCSASHFSHFCPGGFFGVSNAFVAQTLLFELFSRSSRLSVLLAMSIRKLWLPKRLRMTKNAPCLAEISIANELSPSRQRPKTSEKRKQTSYLQLDAPALDELDLGVPVQLCQDRLDRLGLSEDVRPREHRQQARLVVVSTPSAHTQGHHALLLEEMYAHPRTIKSM